MISPTGLDTIWLMQGRCFILFHIGALQLMLLLVPMSARLLLGGNQTHGIRHLFPSTDSSVAIHFLKVLDVFKVLNVLKVHDVFSNL